MSLVSFLFKLYWAMSCETRSVFFISLGIILPSLALFNANLISCFAYSIDLIFYLAYEFSLNASGLFFKRCCLNLLMALYLNFLYISWPTKYKFTATSPLTDRIYDVPIISLASKLLSGMKSVKQIKWKVTSAKNISVFKSIMLSNLALNGYALAVQIIRSILAIIYAWTY